MVLAENVRARIGGNFPPEEIRPRKKDRIVDIRMAKRVLVGASIIALRFNKRQEQITGKRQPDECLVIRRALQLWVDSKGCPKWMQAEIFGLSREAPGAEIKLFEEWTARNEQIEADADALIDGLDMLDELDPDLLADALGHFLRVEPKRFLEQSLTELAADRAAENARKAAKEAADMLERNAPKPAKPKPLSEAEKLLASNQGKRKLKAIAQAIRIEEAVIREGEKPKATKEQRKDAAKARKRLKDLEAALKQKAKRAKAA